MKTDRSIRKALFVGTVVIGLLLSVETASAQGGVVTMTVENDVFTGSDDNYSNGLALTWTSRELSEHKPDGFANKWADAWSFLPGRSIDGAKEYVSFSVMQEMHTPEDISRVMPDPNDQPYAGLLHATGSIYTARGNWAQSWSLRVGLVGPASQADHTQREWHQLIGADDPKGWNAQLKNEPVFNIGYSTGWALLQRDVTKNTSWRFSTILNAEAGTYTTAAGTGFIAEYGLNLPDALSINAFGNSVSAPQTVGAKYEKNWSISGYVGMGAYGVAHYLPLDGTVFRHGPSVGSDPFVTVINAGLTVRKGNLIGSFGIASGANPADDFDDALDFGVLALSVQY